MQRSIMTVEVECPLPVWFQEGATMTLRKRTPIGVALVLGLVAGRLQADDAESQVEALVQSPFGQITHDYKATGKPIIGVNLNFSEVTDADLKVLSGLQRLQTLKLRSTTVTDAGLKALSELKNLQTLDLGDTKVTDAGLK